MTLPAEHGDVHHRGSGVGIEVAENLVLAVTIHTARGQFIAPGGCQAVERFRLLDCHVIVTHGAFDIHQLLGVGKVF